MVNYDESYYKYYRMDEDDRWFALMQFKTFVEWIVSLDDDDPNSPGRKGRQTVTLTQIINRAKEALDE